MLNQVTVQYTNNLCWAEITLGVNSVANVDWALNEIQEALSEQLLRSAWNGDADITAEVVECCGDLVQDMIVTEFQALDNLPEEEENFSFEIISETTE